MSKSKNIFSLSDAEMEALYHAIWQFREAGNVLKQPQETSNRVTKKLYVPMMAFKAFECELEMKYIILKINKCVDKTHDLQILFESLPKCIKSECFGICDDENQFNNLLIENKDAFEKFRYENNFKWIGTFQSWFLDKLSNILYKHIK